MDKEKMKEKSFINEDIDHIVIDEMNLDDYEDQYSFIDELNSNNLEYLIDKYGKTEEDARQFTDNLLTYCYLYTSYPLAMRSQFPKIATVVTKLNEKYELGDMAKKIPVQLYAKIKQLYSNSKLYEDKIDEGEFLIDSKLEQMGVPGLFRNDKFENTNRILAHGFKKINEAMKKNNVLPSKKEYDYNVRREPTTLRLDGFPEECQQMAENYLKEYPLLTLLHDTDVICTLTYLINSQSYNNKESAEILALNLIDYSQTFSTDDVTFDYNLYNHVAKNAIKSIKKNHKKDKKDSKVLQYIKK